MKSVEPEDAEGAGDSDGPEGSDASTMESALDRPEWDDEYFDWAAERFMHNYDLQWECVARSERFDLFSSVRVEGQGQFLHRFVNYASHHAMEYMSAWRVDTATVAELEWLVELGRALADEWIGPGGEHYGTEFILVLVTDAVPEEIRTFVPDFVGRTFLKFGYCGHYEMNLAVVASNDEGTAASRNANSVVAFTLWSGGSPAAADGLLDRLPGEPRR